MTDTLTLTDLLPQLEAAQADLALCERLNTAGERVKRLAPLVEKARVAEAKARAAAEAEAEKTRKAAEEAARDARFAGLGDLLITEEADLKNPHVLSNIYRISYTRDAWLAEMNTNIRQRTTPCGFTQIPSEVLAWIVQRHPDKLPTAITDLAPGDIDEALDRYFTGLRRGFLAS